ncbi:MAG: AzlC family ABC transporter permease [Treponema sp.]|nr:AzlC family ABC transporter permease [Treponema sp.]
MASLFAKALRYSFPVLLGYLAIGSAFGLLLADAGYPWWLAVVMGLVMYAGAGQYIAVGLFAAGTTLWEAVLVQLMVNARHIAYGLSMMNRFKGTGRRRFYLIFGLTDETFALLSSMPENQDGKEQSRFMFLVTLLNQSYWVTGSLIGAIAGALIPFDTEGIGYALTALFIVLMIEQMLRLRKAGVFIVSAVFAVLCVVFLPARISLLAALAIALAIGSFLPKKDTAKVDASRVEADTPKDGGT